MPGPHRSVHPRVQSQAFVRTEFGTACCADEHLLARIRLALMHLRVKMQGLDGCETLITVFAAIVAAYARVHAEVPVLGELLRALIALVHPCGRQAFFSYLYIVTC